MSTVAERVAAGCAWLDEHDPGWWREDAVGNGPAGGPVNLDEMSMRSTCNCVLGQIYGGYYNAPIQLDESVARGFDTSVLVDSRESNDVAGDEFGLLTVEWSRVITDRREAEARRVAAGVAACCPCRGAVCDPGCPCTSGECPKTEAEVTDE